MYKKVCCFLFAFFDSFVVFGGLPLPGRQWLVFASGSDDGRYRIHDEDDPPSSSQVSGAFCQMGRLVMKKPLGGNSSGSLRSLIVNAKPFYFFLYANCYLDSCNRIIVVSINRS